MPALKAYLKAYEPVIHAIVELFAPFVEVAVHDLKLGKVAAIYHNISQRKVGEDSPLTELKVSLDQFPDVFAPYFKNNWDGRPLKCTSITIRNAKQEPIGLICINVDTSFFQDAQRLFNLFLRTEPSSENPVEMFGQYSEEQILSLIQEFLDQYRLSIQHLKRNEKKDLVQHLHQKGVFNFKNAPSFVAAYLKISRASIYNYIKHIHS
jgi:predicted transcriptional regulator YheO